MEFHFSRQADLDLEEIALFIARDNPARAFAFAEEIRQHCHRLMRFPRQLSCVRSLAEACE